MPRKIEKDAALEHALTLFWDHGYRGTSMDMLTSTLGVEKPSIYASFGSKQALYLAALAQYRSWLIGWVQRSLRDAPSARAGIDRTVRLMMARSSRKSRKGCFATNSALELADHDPLVLKEVRTTFAQLVAVFVTAVQAAQADGDVRSDRAPQLLAQLLVNAIEGARIMEKSRAVNGHGAAMADLILCLLDRH
ncbi:MAG: TetR family transcriptional regulator [Nevskia sp.]|nr:TetR family transcriptional regulator [Nevskia sp.]